MLKQMRRFNTWLATLITRVVGSMWCAYVFSLLALLSLPDAISGGKATLVAWIAQTFLQLVLLSVIMVGQEVNSAKSEDRAEKDHEMITEEFEMLHESLEEIKDLHDKLLKVSRPPL